jgi:hypothetical protein
MFGCGEAEARDVVTPPLEPCELVLTLLAGALAIGGAAGTTVIDAEAAAGLVGCAGCKFRCAAAVDPGLAAGSREAAGSALLAAEAVIELLGAV